MCSLERSFKLHMCLVMGICSQIQVLIPVLGALAVSAQVSIDMSLDHPVQFPRSATMTRLSQFLLMNIIGPSDSLNNIRNYHNNIVMDLSLDGITTATNQLKPALVIIIGCTISLLSVFLVVLLYFWSLRKEAHATTVMWVPRSTKYLKLYVAVAAKRILLTVVLFASVGMVTFGGVCLFIEISHLKKSPSEIFIVMNYTIGGAYQIKNTIGSKLSQVPYLGIRTLEKNMQLSHFAVLTTLETFSMKLKDNTDKIKQMSRGIDNELRYLHRMADFNVVQMELLLGSLTEADTLLETVNKTINDHNIVSTDPLQREAIENITKLVLEISKYDLKSNMMNRSENQHLVTSLYKNLTGTQFSTDISKTRSSLYNFSFGSNLDTPIDMKELKTFGEQLLYNKTREAELFKFFLDRIFPDSKLEQITKNLDQIRIHMKKAISIIHPCLTAISIVSVSLIFPIVVGTLFGLIATECYGIRKKCFYPLNLLSNSGGNILESAAYIACIFVWFFWAVSVMVFIICIPPNHLCISLGNMNATDVPLSELMGYDHSSMAKHNINEVSNGAFYRVTFKDILRNCSEGKAILEIFQLCRAKDTLYNVSISHLPKTNSEKILQMVNKMLSNIKPFTIDPVEQFVSFFKKSEETIGKQSVRSLLQLSYLMKQVFHATTDLHRQVESNVIRLHSNVPGINSLYIATKKLALKFFHMQKIMESLVDENSNSRTNHVAYVIKLCERVLADSKEFNDYMTFNASSDLVEQLVNNTITSKQRMVYSIDYTLLSADRDNSECNSVVALHQRLRTFYCQHVFGSLANMWVSLLLIASFLLVTVLVSIPVCWLFKLPVTRDKKDDWEGEQIYDFDRRRRNTENSPLPQTDSTSKVNNSCKLRHRLSEIHSHVLHTNL